MSLFSFRESNSAPFNKIYNGQTWFIRLNLINIKRGVNIALVTDNINQMILCNDIECLSPTFELTYFDLGQTLNKIVDENNLLLKVEMAQPSPNPNDKYWDKENLLNLELLFDINKVETLFKKNNNTMYRFHTLHHNKTFLSKTVNYATIKNLKDTSNTKESPLIIINKLLSKVGYPIDQIVNDTTQRINFISSQTMTVEDCIDHLLRKAVSINDPPTYFVHNLKSGRAMLINNKTLEDRLYNPSNDLNVYGNTDSKNLNFDLLSQISDLTNHSFNAGILSERYLSQFKFRQFDQNTRRWNVVTFDYNKINNLFNRQILRNSKNYESVFTIKGKIDVDDISYDFPVHNEQKMYGFLRQLQLGVNSISFDVTGNVTRDAGQYINLNCSNESQIPKYEGLWNIYSCKHIWSDKSYTNSIACYRTYHKKPIWNEQNQNRNTGV